MDYTLWSQREPTHCVVPGYIPKLLFSRPTEPLASATNFGWLIADASHQRTTLHKMYAHEIARSSQRVLYTFSLPLGSDYADVLWN